MTLMTGFLSFLYPIQLVTPSVVAIAVMTLMTENGPKHSFVFLMKFLPYLSHCFRSYVMGFYQQWALVVLHDFDSD